MRRWSALPPAFVLALLMTLPGRSAAQRVLGPGDDALVLPSGVLRIRTIGQWLHADHRFGSGTPGRPDGSLEPLAVDFNLDTVGIVQFPNLAPLQSGLRALAGIPDFTVSLGRTIVNADVDVTVTPLALEYGVTRTLSVGVLAPFVTTQNHIVFDANPRQDEGNVGFNPALASPAALDADTALVNQFGRASAQLSAALSNCQANPGQPGCATLNANRANAVALIASADAFAAGLGQVYTSSPFIPVAGTDVQAAINARVAAFKALYTSFGAGGVISSAGPFAAANRLGVADAQRILTDSAFGIVSDPLQTATHSHWGDIEIGAKYLWLDSFHGDTQRRLHPAGWNYRLAVGATFRLGTGQTDSPDNFIDVGTGTGANAVSGRLFLDALYGNHFWVSSVARYTDPFADRQTIRVIDAPNRELAPLYRRQTVDRQLGAYREVEITPRVVVNDYFSVTAQWYYRHKAKDAYTGTYTIPAAVTGFGDITIDAATNDLETEQTEHRLGFGFAWSTLKAFADGRTHLPLEVTYFHQETTRGTLTTKWFSDQLMMRLYVPLFGGRGKPTTH